MQGQLQTIIICMSWTYNFRITGLVPKSIVPYKQQINLTSVNLFVMMCPTENPHPHWNIALFLPG